MANIEVTLNGYDFIIDKDLFVRLKEQVYFRLEKTPNGLASVIEDMDFETFRRQLEKGLPTKTGQVEEGLLATALGVPLEGGLHGLVFQAFKTQLGGTPPGNLCIDTLTYLVLVFGSSDIDGEVSPISESVWDTNNTEDWCLKTAKALERSLSGQEQGY